MNYYPFHIGDFRSGTVNMTRRARWIYRDMLDVYYDTEQPLTLDFDLLCDSIGVDTDEEREIVARHLRFKFMKTEQGYRNDVCDRVIAEYRARAETAKANGKRGGRPRNQNGADTKPSGFPSGSDQVAGGNPDETGSEANQEPITNNQEPVTNTAPPAQPARAPRKPSEVVVTLDDLVAEGVDAQHAKDWLIVRKDKGAKKLTVTAWKAVKREAEIAGISAADAVKTAAENTWQGFKASWMSRAITSAGAPNRQEAIEARNRAVGEAWLSEEEGGAQ